MSEKPVYKISDYPFAESLVGDEKIAYLRSIDNKYQWVGGNVVDILSYLKRPKPTTEEPYLKRVNDELRQHIDGEVPHLYDDRDALEQKGYKFVWTTTKGIMEFRPIATVDTFTPDLSEDYLKFLDMYDRHTGNTLTYHKLYDENTSSWKWYKITLVEETYGPVFEMEMVDVNENPEVLDLFVNQQNDWYYYSERMTEHKTSLYPHKLSGDGRNFGFVIEDSELSIEIEE